MTNTFEFVGKIVPCKETEKFHPYEERQFEKGGWGKKTLKFNVQCGNNRNLVEVSAMTNTDESKMNVYTFTKNTVDENGVSHKGESIVVPFKDRFKAEITDKVAEYKKFILDTEVPSKRYKLKKALDMFKENAITDEQMEEYGVHSYEECEKALKDSKAKEHKFISAYDFVDCLHKFISNPKISDLTFKVTGTYEVDYNENKDTWYTHYYVQRVYLQNSDTPTVSNATFDFVFGREAVDDTDYEETKKAKVIGYIPQYLSNYKKTCFYPFEFTLDGSKSEADDKKAKFWMKKFEFPEVSDCDYREIGIVCKVLNGSQEVEITEDMLTEEQRENLEFGLITMEDIKAELGKPVYGDRVVAFVPEKLAKNFSKGAVDTSYTDKDFRKPNIIDDDEDSVFDVDVDIDI